MGCGSSSLKGEKLDVNSDPAPQPLKKVQTNFSDVNFAGAQNDVARRGKSIALAPDEQRRVTEIEEEDDDPVSSLPRHGGATTEGEKLQPYRSIGEDNKYLGGSITGPSVTSPKMSVSSSTGLLSPNNKGKPIVGMSDEELMKKVGMTREEFDAWKNDPKNGVGQHQRADSGIGGYAVFSGM